MSKLGKIVRIGALSLASLVSGCISNSMNDYNYTDNKYSKNNLPTKDLILRDSQMTLVEESMPKNYVHIKKTTYKIYLREKNE